MPVNLNQVRAHVQTATRRKVNGKASRAAPVAFARGDHAELADRLLDVLERDRSRLVGSLNTLWRYTDDFGSWERLDREGLRRIVKGFAGFPRGIEGILKVSASAADGAISLAYAEVADGDFFDEPSPGVAFSNGFAALDGGRIVLREHAPEHRTRFAHRFAYDAHAPATELYEFFDAVFGDVNEDERAARVAFLQEHAGACLTGIATLYQKCALLLGPGGNGKSKTEEVLYRAALPDGTCASLPPQLWGERFQLARLLGALANVCDELPESELLRTGVFKAVVAGEPVHIEQKNRDPFDARLRCGHVVCANALPSTKDLTEGFFRRFAVIRYGRRFDNTAACDPRIAEKIVAACRPGIVAFALEGAARLQRQGHYTLPASSDEALSDWKRSSDSVALFCEEQTRLVNPVTSELGTAAAYLYKRYKAWALENGYQPVSSKTFAARMESAGKGSIHYRDARRYPVVLTAEEGGERE